MSVEQDIADLKRRITLLEEDTKGEKLVTRHILRRSPRTRPSCST